MFFNFNKEYMHTILRSSMMERRFLLAIILIASIVTVGVGLVFPNSVAESPAMKTVSSLNDSQSPKYYYLQFYNKLIPDNCNSSSSYFLL